MIEIYLRSALGPAGWDLLQLLLAYQLPLSCVVVGGYLALRVLRRTRSLHTNPDQSPETTVGGKSS